jgi:short-subunit dehydrogenase
VNALAASKFTGKVVWITGASSGIGEALARGFAAAGSHVILSARREVELQRVAALCSNASSVSILPLDLSMPERMADAAQHGLQLIGHIDAMVHNAGVSQRSLIADTTYEVDNQLMRTNYLGPVALTKAVLPSMRQRGSGHFIVITSVLGKFGLPGRSGYCAAKHALHGFFDTLRAEVFKDGIQVTLALPGWVRTNVSLNSLTGNGTPHAKMDPGTAGGMTPDECAQRIIAAAESGKDEVYVLRSKELLALTVSRFAPALFRRIIRGRPL